MGREVSVVIVDFPEQALPINGEHAKVVLAVRVVVIVEGVELRDGILDRKLGCLMVTKLPTCWRSSFPLW